MEIRDMQCKSCRNECALKVTICEGEIREVTGNGCRRGLVSAQKILDAERKRKEGGAV